MTAMDNTINLILSNADYFVLVIFRVGALLFNSPIFGRANIPAMAKICLIASVGYLFFTVFPPVVPIVYGSLLEFFFIILKEVLLGVALAYVTNVYFSLTLVAGQLIDLQIGLSVASIYDAQTRTQVPITGNILNIVMMITFFAVNGHQRLIHMVYLSMESLPVGNLEISPDIALIALEVFSHSFLLGVQVALPIIASGLVLEICFGLLVRTVPQLNMFVVGMPVKTLVGFFMLSAIIPVFVVFTDSLFSHLFVGVDKMFSAFLIG